MSRAIILPTLTDPYLLSAWVKLYSKNFRGEADKLYALLASDSEPAITEYCASLFRDVGAVVFTEPRGIDHGDAIRCLLERCDEDTVCLIEDDLFVLQAGALDREFKKIESGQFDIIGSSRSSASQELLAIIRQSFKLTGYSPEHAISECPNLWPCMLFTKKQYLLDTDRNFNSRTWRAGEKIEYTNVTASSDCSSDTFGWATMQLRARGLRFGYVNQFHAADVDRQDIKINRGLFTPNGTPWVHFGSLSSGFCGNNLLLVVDDSGKFPISRKYKNLTSEYCEMDQGSASSEVSRRLALWRLFSKHNRIANVELSHYNDMYEKSVDDCIKRYNIEKDVAEFEVVYFKMLKDIFE